MNPLKFLLWIMDNGGCCIIIITQQNNLNRNIKRHLIGGGYSNVTIKLSKLSSSVFLLIEDLLIFFY